jgi:hypothetical protein
MALITKEKDYGLVGRKFRPFFNGGLFATDKKMSMHQGKTAGSLAH